MIRLDRWNDPDGLRRVLQRMAERHGVLAADLAGLAAGTAPDPAVLADAPVLTDWRYSSFYGDLLIGRVSEHPHLADGTIHTSEIIAIDPGRGFARTLSRWYVLGEPFLVPGRQTEGDAS